MEAARDFVALFANTVTVPSKGKYDWVARTGRHSVFSILTIIAPKVSKKPDFSS